MVDNIDCSICPISWESYQENVKEALKLIAESDLPNDIKETIYELIELEDVMGFPKIQIKNWKDTLELSNIILPENCSVPEVMFFHNALKLLADGKLDER